MPSWELFEQQDKSYRDHVLPPAAKGRLAVEQGATLGWDRYIGIGGGMIGMRSFGASAPLAVLQAQFGFTPAAVLEEARRQAKRA
jgi:transketolase